MALYSAFFGAHCYIPFVCTMDDRYFLASGTASAFKALHDGYDGMG